MLPTEISHSRRKLHQFIKYGVNVYALPQILGGFSDTRRTPRIPTQDVVTAIFLAATFRLPSINALEGDLREADFQKAIGLRSHQGVKAFSAEVVSNVLDKLDVAGPREAIENIVWRAERNKAFRDDTYGAMRCVAMDGWEPFTSYQRSCSHCLEREISVKNPDTGEVEKRTQYYHRYVVAMLVAPVLDLVLDIEPVLNNEARRKVGEDAHHEGELTAAYRLLDRLHGTYGSFIDAFILDALYANGPVMTKLDEHGYGGFIVLKKDGHEPLKEALALWEGSAPCGRHDDTAAKEHIDFWDAGDLETLDSYKGKVRVIRAVVTKQDSTVRTWCFGMVGERARRTGLRGSLKIVRARWHIENTAFNQWVSHWNLAHVYRHTDNAIQAVLLLWALVFNLLQVFVYRRLKRVRNPKDPCNTIRNIIEVMRRDLATLSVPVPWSRLVNTS